MINFNEWVSTEGWNAVRFRQSNYKPHETVIGNVKLKLAKDTDTGEYIVKWIENNRVNDDKSYFTNDLTDAMQTMDAMAKRLLAQGSM